MPDPRGPVLGDADRHWGGAARRAASRRDGWRPLAPWLAAALVAQAAMAIAGYRSFVTGAPPIGPGEGDLLQVIYGLSMRWNAFGWLGFWRGLGADGGGPSAPAVLASLVEVYGGGGRLALLLPGLALLVLSELAFAAAALRLTRSPGLAALGLGLLMLRTRPWLAGTGLFTVNAGWPACCCFGMAASLMIAPPARHRLDRGMLVAAAGLATLCFSVNAFACLLAVAALRLAIGPGIAAARAAAAAGFAIAAAALLRIAGACPSAPMTRIRLDGGEVARCGYGLRTSLLYLASFDLGLACVLAAVLSLGALLALVALRGRRGPRLRADRGPGTEGVFFAAVLAALACIQVARRSADPIGSGLADIPLAALLLAGLAALARRLGGTPERRFTRLAGFGVLALSAVLPWSYTLLDAPLPDGGQRRAASEAAFWLVRDAEVNGRARASVLAAPVPRLLNGPALSAFSFETFGESAAFTVLDLPADGGDLGAPDYAIVPARAFAGAAGAALQRRLDAAMVRRTRLDPRGLDLVVYSAPNISVAGVSGDWLLAAGTSLRFATGEIPAGSVIALRGPDGYARYVPEPPAVTAVATLRNGGTLPLPARFVRAGDGYNLFVDPEPVAAAGKGQAEVALTFNRFFVPRDVGLNQDPRRLAVMAPTSVGLVPRAAFDAAGGAP